MCIFCEMKKALGLSKEVEIPVGTVSPQLLADWQGFQNTIAEKQLEGEEFVLKAKKEALESGFDKKVVEAKRKEVLEVEAKGNEELAKIEADLWDRTYAELNLDPENGYKIDRKTGLVRQVVDEDDAPVAEGTH